MTSWDHYICLSKYDELEDYIINLKPVNDSHKNIKKNKNLIKLLKEKLLNYYLINNFNGRFILWFNKFDDKMKNQENILTLLISYYCQMNNVDQINIIIDKLINMNNLKRRHLICFLNYLIDTDIDNAHNIIVKHHMILNAIDFELFLNECYKLNRINYIDSTLNLIIGRQLDFQNLMLSKKCDVNSGVCINCCQILEYKKIDTNKLIQTLVNNNSKFDNFIIFAKTNTYDIVIDTANIFYYILNKNNPIIDEKSFDFLEKILSSVKLAGFTNPLLIIHKRHKKLTNGNKTFIDNLTWWTPYNMNDDYFSMVACWLKYPIPIVTDDLFRDHKYLLDGSDIEQWYKDMVVKYDKSINLVLNNKYSKIIQKNGKKIHIPIMDGIICYQN